MAKDRKKKKSMLKFVRRLYNNGYRVKEIAQILNVDTEDADNLVTESKLEPERVKVIRKLKKAGLKSEYVGELLNIPSCIVDSIHK